jgi:hypothetical protein
MLKTVDDGFFGPIRVSAVDALTFHLATVLALTPYRLASVLMLS